MQSIPATYHDGAFYPVGPVELPEGSKVNLHVSPEVPSSSGNQDATGGSLEEQITQIASRIEDTEWASLATDLNDRLDEHLYGTSQE